MVEDAARAAPVKHPAAGPTDVTGGMVFPQMARLELDELLEQLVARARDVQDTQGRLRGLLRAYREVARALELEELLLHIVNAALQLAEARQDSERLRTVQDRQQIAEDLHHRVIQRLFALGLTLQALALRVANHAIASTINEKVDEIDGVIRDIRTVVFALNRPDGADLPLPTHT